MEKRILRKILRVSGKAAKQEAMIEEKYIEGEYKALLQLTVCLDALEKIRNIAREGLEVK